MPVSLGAKSVPANSGNSWYGAIPIPDGFRAVGVVGVFQGLSDVNLSWVRLEGGNTTVSLGMRNNSTGAASVNPTVNVLVASF